MTEDGAVRLQRDRLWNLISKLMEQRLQQGGATAHALETAMKREQADATKFEEQLVDELLDFVENFAEVQQLQRSEQDRRALVQLQDQVKQERFSRQRAEGETKKLLETFVKRLNAMEAAIGECIRSETELSRRQDRLSTEYAEHRMKILHMAVTVENRVVSLERTSPTKLLDEQENFSPNLRNYNLGHSESFDSELLLACQHRCSVASSRTASPTSGLPQEKSPCESNTSCSTTDAQATSSPLQSSGSSCSSPRGADISRRSSIACNANSLPTRPDIRSLPSISMVLNMTESAEGFGELSDADWKAEGTPSCSTAQYLPSSTTAFPWPTEKIPCAASVSITKSARSCDVHKLESERGAAAPPPYWASSRIASRTPEHLHLQRDR
eukprot:gnl/TRDRNA2_/TRDRNA2_202710_c0_seq1.p1 gnl/TRDRNA2_/TRDRNA2_202710_c0~~gnl/TRDRNA2_/TRDRNA2_202710_c0_seq1.p1  ORF type:complete len:404 (+),score=69.75 gnl/TRDRNA2_/TRDRNA2_202710_c0_seq1:60-1214(+)